jgi:SAM-dependent methyltransferase
MSLRFYEIAEKYHRILNPFTPEKLMLLGEIFHLKPGLHQLDLACGKGETLCRWAQTYGIQGTGVDISGVFIEAARNRAVELGVGSQVSFVLEDAVQYQAQPDTYDVVSCIGANWLGGGTRGTLELVKGKGLKHHPDSLILMGEIFWRTEPSPEVLENAGVKPGEWAVGLDGITKVFEESGTRLVEMVLATETDWDRYQSKHWWAFDEWMRANPDDPEIETLAAFAEKSRQDYFRIERPLCDWGVFVLKLAGA